MSCCSKGTVQPSTAYACAWAGGSPNTINDHLDTWWAKLGSRLRDVPGHEFPQLPERVAQSLQHLWNEALEERIGRLEEHEHATGALTGALEEGLTLAREQLAAANQRAQALETSVQERDAEGARLRSRIERLEADCAEWRARLDAAAVAHHCERVQLQERTTAAESHWMLEVDRARQSAKESAKQHEQQTKELRRQLEALTGERDELQQGLLGARAELKTAAAVREQLEERLRAASRTAPERASTSAPTPRGPSQAKRSR